MFAWDFVRLNYEAQRVRAQVSTAGSFAEIAEACRRDLTGGEPHAVRAWGEIGAPAIAERFGLSDPHAAGLREELEHTLEGLLSEPERVKM